VECEYVFGGEWVTGTDGCSNAVSAQGCGEEAEGKVQRE